MKKKAEISIAALIACASSACVLASPVIVQDQMHYPSDNDAMDYFGTSVEIDGNRMVVGAMNYEPQPNNSGLRIGGAWIFDLTTGAELQLVRNDPNTDPSDTAGDQFGYISSISGDYAIVGSHADDNQNGNNAGSAYIFDADTGAQLHKLIALDISGNPEFANPTSPFAARAFGKYVAMDGDMAVVTAIHDGSGGSGPKSHIGSAYFYEVATGEQMAIRDMSGNPNSLSLFTNKLRSTDSAGGKNFGKSVAIDGNYVVISSGNELSDIGRVYVYEMSNIDYVNNTMDIQEIQIIDKPGGGASSSRFGTWVDIDETTIVVGDSGLSDGSSLPLAGAAYVFDGLTGTQISQLIATDSHIDDHFGWSVAIDLPYAVVGAPRSSQELPCPVFPCTNPQFAETGAMYVFDAFTGTQLTSRYGSDGRHGDNFGRAVDISYPAINVGAILNSRSGSETQAGKVYEFQFGSCVSDCDGNGVVDFADLVAITFAFGPAAPGDPCDVNCDGVIDSADLDTALYFFGPCP